MSLSKVLDQRKGASSKPVSVSTAQYEQLKKICYGSVPGRDIPTVTRCALLRKGLIEQCERMYFGPREYRLRLSPKGRQVFDFLQDMYGE